MSRISANVDDESVNIVIVDKTILGRNSTSVVLGGEEVERTTRNGRKKFMLSVRADSL